MNVVRYNGKWFEIVPKPYEPERQTYQIAWMMIKQGITSSEAYRKWYSNEQSIVKVLYPSFRKDGA